MLMNIVKIIITRLGLILMLVVSGSGLAACQPPPKEPQPINDAYDKAHDPSFDTANSPGEVTNRRYGALLAWHTSVEVQYDADGLRRWTYGIAPEVYHSCEIGKRWPDCRIAASASPSPHRS
jgi:hypothetical protein